MATNTTESGDRIETSADVLIVGAGPVGLMLAGELALAGVQAAVVEASAHPHGEEKARGVGVLGAEALRRRGLGTRLRMPFRAQRPDTQAYMGQHQSHFAWIHKFDHGSMREPGRTPAVIWQPELEQLLAEHARALGVRIYRGHTVVELASGTDGMVTSIQTPRGRTEFTSRYVVGCDGGRSSVRTMWNFDFPGVAPTGVHLLARLKVEDPARLPAEMEGPRGAFASRGPREGWMFVRMSEPVDVAERGPRDPLTVEDMRAAISRITGVDVVITEMDGARRGYDNSRQASTYRLGRVFLAGDAAHVHSPLGGQGLNLGLMDAVNLGWKLAYAVHDAVHAEDLLDSYTRERHPVGAAVLHNTRAQTALLAPTPHARAMRDIVSDLLDIHDVKVYFNEMMTGTGIRYPLPHATGNHPLLGGHIGNLVVDDTSLYAEMTDGRPLLIHHVAVTDIAAVAQPWADRVHIRSALTLDRNDLCAALVRPDGVVVWAAQPTTPPDPAALREALTTWFGPAAEGGIMQPLASFDRATNLAIALVESLRDDQLSYPTPCSEWTIRDILNHLRIGTLIATAAVHGTPPPDRGQDHLGDDPRRTVVDGLRSCRALLNEPGMITRQVTGPMGQISVAAFAERGAADITAHLWDLSRAIGRPTDYDPELNDFVLGHYKTRLDGKDRTGAPIAAAREPHADATAADLLAAYLGRDPDFTSAS